MVIGGWGSQETRGREYAPIRGYYVAAVCKDDITGERSDRPGCKKHLVKVGVSENGRDPGQSESPGPSHVPGLRGHGHSSELGVSLRRVAPTAVTRLRSN